MPSAIALKGTDATGATGIQKLGQVVTLESESGHFGKAQTFDLKEAGAFETPGQTKGRVPVNDSSRQPKVLMSDQNTFASK